MRRNFKRFIVCALSSAMVMGGPISALAEETGQTGAAGTGRMEGIKKAEETKKPEVYQVLLPSDVNDIFDFILDPQKLIEETNAAAYGGKSFEKGSTLFFHRSDGRAAEEFSSSSDYVTIINRSNVPVDVEVNVSIVPDSLGGITMTGDRGFTNDNGASLYMALTDGVHTTPIGMEGTSIQATIPAAPEHAFVYSYDQENSQYIYGLRGDLEGIQFPEYSFQLTGAVNEKGDWSALENVAPVVNVTWKVSPGQSLASGEENNSEQNLSSEGSAIFKQIFETVPVENEAGGEEVKPNREAGQNENIAQDGETGKNEDVVRDGEVGQNEDVVRDGEAGQNKNVVQDGEEGQNKKEVQDEEADQKENAVQNQDTTENGATVLNRAAGSSEKSNSEK